MHFEILGDIESFETIAAGSGIREISQTSEALWPCTLAQA
jgi:hypothetical protein